MADKENQQIVYESPESIDKVLSKELLQLSLRDRNAIDEEIHGVSTPVREESPEFLKKALEELSDELSRIPDDSSLKESYNQSQKFPETYVNTDEFRLRFLRCELFDAEKAAIRMVKFLGFASHLFGPVVLRRSMRITDLNKDERKLLMIGHSQMFPFRDRSGRLIFTRVGGFEFKDGDVKSRNKVALYVQYVFSDDVDSQRKGMVFLIWACSSRVKADFKWENIEYARRMTEALPLRLCAIHNCVPDTPYYHIVRAAYGIVLGKSLSRLKYHIGEKVELLYTLKSYGIPTELIPVTDTGNIKTTYLKQWTRARKTQESMLAKGDCNASSIILSPRTCDVIFRGGIALTCHPGNSMFQNMIESKLGKHSSGSQKEKIVIVKDIIKDVQQKKGRFLQWDSRGWWVELKDASQIHAKIAEKVRNLSGKVVARQQNFRSSTFVFQNQDNAKRRKLTSGNDSDGSGNEGCCLFSMCTIEERNDL